MYDVIVCSNDVKIIIVMSFNVCSKSLILIFAWNLPDCDAHRAAS